MYGNGISRKFKARIKPFENVLVCIAFDVKRGNRVNDIRKAANSSRRGLTQDNDMIPSLQSSTSLVCTEPQ